MNRTFSNKQMNGTKDIKERITIALTMIADGTEKLKPLIISKARRPRCFGKIFNPQSISYYYNNQKAWMNMIIFKY